MPPRRPLAALPTPLQRLDRLSAAWRGPTIWVKRDDLTGFGLSGNKVRKLEFHVAAARDAAADVLLTCGAVQSNHCRATAIAAARLGLDSVLFLRSESGKAPVRPEGNHLISLLAGADVRFVDREWYEARDTNMAETAARLEAGGRGSFPKEPPTASECGDMCTQPLSSTHNSQRPALRAVFNGMPRRAVARPPASPFMLPGPGRPTGSWRYPSRTPWLRFSGGSNRSGTKRSEAGQIYRRPRASRYATTTSAPVTASRLPMSSPSRWRPQL